MRNCREFSCGFLNHPFDEIDTRHFLRHAMLDLQARVDFEKIEIVGVGIIEKFDCASIGVADALAERDGGLPQRSSRRCGEIRCWCLFNDFLISALCRTVTLAERQNIAFAVSKDLNFDMPSALDIFLQKNAGIFEVVSGEAHNALVHRLEFNFRFYQLKANSATARRAFQHDRIADAPGFYGRGFSAVNEAGARRERNAGFFSEFARRVLQGEGAHVLGSRSDEANVFYFAGFSEARIF